MSTELLLDADALRELSALLTEAEDAAPEPPSPTVVEPSDELVEVTRRIASQYVAVLHAAVSAAFGSRDPAGPASQLVTALDALARLAAAADDDAHLALIAEIRPAAVAFAGDPRRRARDRFLAQLRPWLGRYADHLGGEDGRLVRSLVRFDTTEAPLLAELAAIPGIGPRRLERLFCAGLYAVEVVSVADPDEVAAVTGLPRALAADVVARARAWAEERRRRCVIELRTRLAEFQRVLAGLDPAAQPELWALARAVVADMSTLVQPPVETR